jgi:DNA-binding NarL/FixJ family response regulator
MNPIRVFLADDHDLVRAGFKALLERMQGIEFIGEAGDGREAIKLVASLMPDVVLMDINMPGMNGLEALGRINKEYPDIIVIVVSVSSNEEIVAQSLRFGASGYLLKSASPSELETAIRTVVKGGMYLTPQVSKSIVQSYLQRVTKTMDFFDILTPRQREILQLIGEGHTTKDIASILFLSVKTVERHRAELMERLDIHDIAGLIRYALKTYLSDTGSFL